jgi:hypothetical protein
MHTTPTLSRRLRTALAILAAGAAFAAPALASPYGDATWADGSIVDAQLRVDGHVASLYDSPRGDRRHYFEAIAGGHYSVVLRNNTGRRVGVLISVDGLNVVNGERSSLSSTEPMYVLGPYESTTINGWRTSLDAVRRFVFVDEKRSYAERTGQANADMGWIRVLAFRELRPWWEQQGWRPGSRYLDDTRRRDESPRAAAPAPTEERSEPQANAPGDSREVAPPAARGELKANGKTLQESDGLAGGAGSYPGTGWGERRNDPVQQVQFTAERTATDTHLFRYEYAAGLQALGIDLNRNRLRDRDRGQLGFAKPPRW